VNSADGAGGGSSDGSDDGDGSTGRRVIVYTTALCPPCDDLKAYLTSRDVPFETADPMMDEDAAEFLEDHNVRSAPALRVGDQVVGGGALTRERVDELLGL
jgi:glutaredoxin